MSPVSMFPHRQTWIVVLMVAVLFTLLRMSPSWLGYGMSPTGYEFIGFGHLPIDMEQYAAFIAQAKESASFPLRNEYTLQAQDGRFVLLFHYLVGRVADLFDAYIPVAWDVAVVVLGACILFLQWVILGRFVGDSRYRALGFLILCFGGGLEWVIWLASPYLPATWVAYLVPRLWPEIGWNGYESLYNGLWSFAILATLLISMFLVAGSTGTRLGRLLMAGSLSVVLYASHAYTAIALYVTLSLFVGLDLMRRGWRAGWHDPSNRGVVSLLPFAVVVFIINHWQMQDAAFSSVASKALKETIIYPFYLWPITYGALLPFAVIGMQRVWVRWDPPSRLLIAWMVGVAILTNLPVLSPFKYQYLLFMPLAICATIGIESIASKGFSPRSSRLAGYAVASLFITNVAVTAKSIIDLRQRVNLYFIRTTELEALHALRKLPYGSLLAGDQSSLHAPWVSRKPVYFGHYFLSDAIGDKLMELRALLDRAVSLEWKSAFVSEHRFDYIYIGPTESAFGQLDNRLPYQVIYHNSDVEIYKRNSDR